MNWEGRQGGRWASHENSREAVGPASCVGAEGGVVACGRRPAKWEEHTEAACIPEDLDEPVSQGGK